MLAGVVSYCTRGSRLSQSNRLLLSGMRKAHLAYKKLRTLCKRSTSAHSAMEKFIMEYSMSFPIDESWLYFTWKLYTPSCWTAWYEATQHNSKTTTAKMCVVIAGSHSRTGCPCRWLPKESSLMKWNFRQFSSSLCVAMSWWHDLNSFFFSFIFFRWRSCTHKLLGSPIIS